jgi:hypothetical protein
MDMLDINDGISQRNPDGTVRLVEGKPVSARITMAPWPEEALKVLRAATAAYLASLTGPSDASARTDAQRELATVHGAMTRFAAGAGATKAGRLPRDDRPGARGGLPARSMMRAAANFAWLCALWLIMVAPPAYAQTPSAVSTADRHHPFVEHVERRYTKYLAAENQGDTAAYKEVRTRWAYETTLEQLKKLGKAESELGSMLKRVASLQSDVSQFTFVRCDARTRVARLLYRRESVGPKGPTLEFAAFMTHWEDGAWRIGWVGRLSGAATRSSGEKLTADELLGDPRFALD